MEILAVHVFFGCRTCRTWSLTGNPFTKSCMAGCWSVDLVGGYSTPSIWRNNMNTQKGPQIGSSSPAKFRRTNKNNFRWKHLWVGATTDQSTVDLKPTKSWKLKIISLSFWGGNKKMSLKPAPCGFWTQPDVSTRRLPGPFKSNLSIFTAKAPAIPKAIPGHGGEWVNNGEPSRFRGDLKHHSHFTHLLTRCCT